MRKLETKAWAAVALVGGLVTLLIFGPAGTFDYRQAWVYLAIFITGSAALTLYLIRNDPELLARRLSAGPAAEKEPKQKIIILLAILAFCALLAISALDWRFGWSTVPTAATMIGDVLIGLGFVIVHFVYAENRFAAATIQVEREQTLVATGPYRFVRHPMYSGGLLLLGATPPALGSWCGLGPFLIIVGLVVWRLVEEEAFLLRHLAGYAEYRKRVRYRLVPFIW